ncbi:hypothetical protein [Methylosinus sp. LW4]|uniref:hypothetical protein n=1 Tax=Methylosinus sp. LW4 TaxID=136993 RepID=UPI000372C8C3|nr:hypothetical protein [Methylosinus sp. LW4]
MLSFLRALFAWRLVAEHGRYAYFENDVAGAREAHVILRNGGTHPAHRRWLAGGDWSYERPPPPRSQSGVKSIGAAR